MFRPSLKAVIKMIDLLRLKIGSKVRIIDTDGNICEGTINAVCEAIDNYDPEDPDTLNEDGICVKIDEGGGPFFYQSDIKELTLLP